MNSMSTLIRNFLAALVLFAYSMQAGALVIDHELNDGVLTAGTTITAASYNTGIIDLDSPITLLIGETLDIQLNFVDAATGARQHLELMDRVPPPFIDAFIERILFQFSGTQSGGDLRVVDISITNVTLIDVVGDLDVNGFDPTPPPLCIIFAGTSQVVSCGSTISTVPDLTDTSFSFHGLEFELTLEQSKRRSGEDFEPIAFQQARFTFQANAIERGEWPVPEPLTATLLVVGIGIGLGSARATPRYRKTT